MGLFDNFLGGLFGQSEAAPAPGTVQAKPIDYAGMANQAATTNLSYLNQMMPGAISAYKAGQAQLDPNFPQTQQMVSGDILRDLGLGTQLPQELSQQSILKSMGQGAQTGWAGPTGVSAGAIGSAARNLGLTGEQLYEQRLNRAQQWMGQQPNPLSITGASQMAFTPTQMANLDLGQQTQMDQYQNYLANRESKNQQAGPASLLEGLGNIAGTIYGMPGVGTAAGSLLTGLFGGDDNSFASWNPPTS